jgi:hypothetical protein
MQRHFILNNNNIICEIFKEEQEFEDKLLLRMIPKHLKTYIFFNIIYM